MSDNGYTLQQIFDALDEWEQHAITGQTFDDELRPLLKYPYLGDEAPTDHDVGLFTKLIDTFPARDKHSDSVAFTAAVAAMATHFNGLMERHGKMWCDNLVTKLGALRLTGTDAPRVGYARMDTCVKKLTTTLEWQIEARFFIVVTTSRDAALLGPEIL